MGKYAVVARRSGSDWYVSMLNAGDKKQISLPIDFLKNRKGYTATLYYQASEEKKGCRRCQENQVGEPQ